MPRGRFYSLKGFFVSLFCTGCRLQTPIPTRETTAPGQKNRHNDLHPHMAQGKTVITGVLQTTRILAVQGDIHIPIQVLARGGCTASVPVCAATPGWARCSSLLPCLAVLGCCTTPRSSDFISKQIPDLYQSFDSNLPA